MTGNKHRELTILQLYPRDMNIYGDTGNLLVLQKRLRQHGYVPITVAYNVGDKLPSDVDIVIGGGGQDSGQAKIHEDLLSISDKLHKIADENTPMLMVCGLYQLFGHFFKTSDGKTLDGIGILDVKTYGTNERLIGNITTYSDIFGYIVGYENHSGQTYLANGCTPLAKTVKGAGNNSSDKHEGAVYNNVIGTYLHGSILPKNPAIADYLIEQACLNKFGEFTPKTIDDSLAEKAREIAMNRPR